MNVLITGGAGYIGSELVYRLSQNPAIKEIVIYDNLSKANYNLFIGVRKPEHPEKVRLIQGDILDRRSLTKALEGIDAVVHAAAFVSTPFANTDPHFFEQINHWGTAQVVDAVEESDVQKFIFLSSVSVYGSSEEIAGIESPLNAHTYYGMSKIRAEKHIKRLENNLQTFILRLGNVYGYSKNIRIDAVVNHMMFHAQHKNLITIHGTGTQKRAFICLQNVVHALDKIISGPVQPGIYNLIDENKEINEVAEEIKRLYPGLEMIFVNQQLKMRTISVKPSPAMKKLIGNPVAFGESLKTFKEMFTF